jgi:hypothetical protein
MHNNRADVVELARQFVYEECYANSETMKHCGRTIAPEALPLAQLIARFGATNCVVLLSIIPRQP